MGKDLQVAGDRPEEEVSEGRKGEPDADESHGAVIAEEALDVGRNLLPTLGRSVGGESGPGRGVSGR